MVTARMQIVFFMTGKFLQCGKSRQTKAEFG